MLAATLLAATPAALPAAAGGVRAGRGGQGGAAAGAEAEASSFAETLAALLGITVPGASTSIERSLPRSGEGQAGAAGQGGGESGLLAPTLATAAQSPLIGFAAQSPDKREGAGDVSSPAPGSTFEASPGLDLSALESSAQPEPPLTTAATPVPVPAAVAESVKLAAGTPLVLSGVRKADVAPPTSETAVAPPPAADAAPPLIAAAASSSHADSGAGGQHAAFERPAPEFAAPVIGASSEPATFEPVVALAETPELATPAPTRATPETVAALAAEMARKLDAQTTRFDLRLNPDGLGEVQVALEIRAGGDVSAHLSFERPETMADLRARAAELREALEQVGFTVAGENLSFDSPDRRAPERHARSAGPAFTLLEAEPPPALPTPTRGRSAVDLRI